MSTSLIIVSNRLPISVKKTENGLEFYPSIGGLATGLAGYTKDKNSKWIGWPGIASDQLTDEEKIEITQKMRDHNCYPVFLTQKQLDGFYNGYSNSILWPLFHGIAIAPSAIKNQKTYWDMYKEVNAVYANHVLKLCEEGSNIWINDYQLILLPALLRQQHLTDKIGFFLHIPFPESKNFVGLENAYDLILGILGAELIGLHTESYANNLISTCKRLKIGLLTEDCIAIYDRIIRITNFPMGIDYARFAYTVKLKSVKKEISSLRNKYIGKKIILTVDRLDPTKGLVERAVAYRDFLQLNPEQIGKTTMIMLVVPSRTQIEEYKNLRVKLEKIINEVNAEFQTPVWQPIEFMYTCIPLEKLVALYQLADIAFIAPLKDGMNLVSKEYIASKPGNNGVLILSKTAGAAEELHDALIVDPSKPKTFVRALEKAISMSQSEMQRRFHNMQKHISVYTVQNWANNFITSLLKSPGLPPVHTKSLSPNWQTEMVTEYSTALKRVLLLDYDGTLTPFVDKPELAEPSIQLKQLLRELAACKQNKVVIVSGRDKNSLGSWFSHIPVTLVAEHGSFIHRHSGNRWYTTSVLDPTWKPMISNILNQFVAKVPGSFIEQKESSLVWHYRVAKPYYVKKYLAPLKRLLQPLVNKLDLKMEQGSMILEIRPSGANKGVSALEFSKNADFVLAIGDDTTDEEMFAVLPKAAWTIKVGPGQTNARYRLKYVNEVHSLLNKLKDQSNSIE